MPHIILASGSPRRRELLARMGFREFTVAAPGVDERADASLTPEEAALAVARRKAEAVSAPDDALVIAADTTVVLDGARLGKPRDEDDALRMLTALAGRRHRVVTGVAVRRGEQLETFTASTDVWFRAADEAELRAYVRTGEPMDKAGAYGVQALGALFVERIDGDFYNVMGLPVEALGRVLAGRFGVRFFEGGEAE